MLTYFVCVHVCACVLMCQSGGSIGVFMCEQQETDGRRPAGRRIVFSRGPSGEIIAQVNINNEKRDV